MAPDAVLREVVLAVRAGSLTEAAIRAARAVAAATGVPMSALYVEDPNLHLLAGHPMLREVGALSGTVRPVAEAAIPAALRREAERIRRALDEPGSFGVERGDFVQRVVERLSESVAAVLAPRRGVANVSGSASRPGGGPVMVVLDESPSRERALNLALRLASAGAPLRVAIVARSDAEFRRGEAALLALGSTAGAAPARYAIVRTTPYELPAVVRRSGSAVVVIGVDGQRRERAALDLLASALACPVIVVG